MDKNALALSLLKQNFKIIPIAPNTKIPIKSWPWRDKDFTKAHALKLKRKLNFAVKLEDMTVVDIDTKKGDGFKSFKEATGIDAHEVDTFKVKTPSGGLHLYFKGDHEQRIGVIPNVDIKSKGGYVLAAGCELNGKRYESLGGKIMPKPKWFGKLFREDGKKKEIENTGDDGLIVHESGRNNALTSYVGTLWQAGASKDGLTQEVNRFNYEQCVPPLKSREVQTIIASITKRPRGESRLYASAFSDFADLNPTNMSIHNAAKLSFSDIVPTPWVIEGRYARGFITFISAVGGSGKSLLQLLEALSASSGKDLSGAKVKEKTRVWLHNCEDDLNMLMQRLQAMSMRHDIDQSLMKYLYLSTGREFKIVLGESERDKCIINKDMVDKVVSYIKRYKIGLWLVDPLIHLHRLNENDNGHMNALCDVFTDIAERTGCAIGLAHHTSKATGAARGASSIIDASRVAYRLETNHKSGTVELKPVKNNLSPTIDTCSFKFEAVDLSHSTYPALVHMVEDDFGEDDLDEDGLDMVKVEKYLYKIFDDSPEWETLSLTKVLDSLLEWYPDLIDFSGAKTQNERLRLLKDIVSKCKRAKNERLKGGRRMIRFREKSHSKNGAVKGKSRV